MKRILHVMPLTSWLAWFGAFGFAMLYRYSKAIVPESIELSSEPKLSESKSCNMDRFLIRGLLMR